MVLQSLRKEHYKLEDELFDLLIRHGVRPDTISIEDVGPWIHGLPAMLTDEGVTRNEAKLAAQRFEARLNHEKWRAEEMKRLHLSS